VLENTSINYFEEFHSRIFLAFFVLVLVGGFRKFVEDLTSVVIRNFVAIRATGVLSLLEEVQLISLLILVQVLSLFLDGLLVRNAFVLNYLLMVESVGIGFLVPLRKNIL
jgi:hypothetical protein